MNDLAEIVGFAQGVCQNEFHRQMIAQEQLIVDAMARFGCGVDELVMVYHPGRRGSWEVRHVPGRAWADWHSNNHGWEHN